MVNVHAMETNLALSIAQFEATCQKNMFLGIYSWGAWAYKSENRPTSKMVQDGRGSSKLTAGLN